MIPAPVARLLHTLAGLAPDGATARVPVAALAEATGLQVRRVQQLTRQAQALGFLDIDTQAGRGRANTYTLTPTALQMVQPSDPPRVMEDDDTPPVAPFAAEKVQFAPQMVQGKGATRPEMVQGKGAKKVQSGVMNDSLPGDSESLSLKRTTQTLPGKNHSLAPIAPFSADCTVSDGALARLLVANGFAGTNVPVLARLAHDQGADANAVLKALRWAERQEIRGRVANWHAYLVACVKTDGWQAVAARADLRDPLSASAGRARAAAQQVALDTAAGIAQLYRDLGIDDDTNTTLLDNDNGSPDGYH